MAHLFFQKCYPQINKSLQPQIPYKCSMLNPLVKQSLSALHTRMVSTKGETQAMHLNNYKVLVHIERNTNINAPMTF